MYNEQNVTFVYDFPSGKMDFADVPGDAGPNFDRFDGLHFGCRRLPFDDLTQVT